MSTRIHTKIAKTIAATLVIAAVAAPIAQSSSTPKVDPLAVGYLIGQGLSSSEVTSWTTGACSHQAKAASCYAMLNRSATSTKAVDPLAVGYMIGHGLSSSEVTSWTTGACSHQVKAVSCYAMFKPATTSTPVADSAKPTRVEIPPSLANFREPGSTGYVPQGVSPQPSAGDLAGGDALNRRYHLGKYGPPVQARPKPEGTTTQQWQAELARGDALNQRYGLGAYVETADTSTATTPAPIRAVTVAAHGFDWGVAAVGAGAALGLALATAGALMAFRKRRTLAHA